MSKMNPSSVWLPAEFPAEDRLPHSPAQVDWNQYKQRQAKIDHQDALSIAAGKRIHGVCMRTLHVSLFFDGTGNSLNTDLLLADPPHPTNIARLFCATLGTGIAGGTAHSDTKGLLDPADPEGAGSDTFFKYYMPGVGTPFPEIDDLDYNTDGLVSGTYGEARINWALMMLIDALRRGLREPVLSTAENRRVVKDMGTWFSWLKGQYNRRREFGTQLAMLKRPLSIALAQPNAGHPKLVGLELYVYGFSRGAAAARAFVNWLNELLIPHGEGRALAVGDERLPVNVRFLGGIDTVASVGLADIAPIATGHMDWADGSLAIPEGGLVKRCLHMVAAHEQRMCFPLDSIRREDGSYPENCVEVVYPGVHSDLGGGYVPGDQGKSLTAGEAPDDELLSQICLNDMYGEAFACGAPLKVPKAVLKTYEQWLALSLELEKIFRISPRLTARFNAWRTLALETAGFTTHESATSPARTRLSLEQVLTTQMAWLTAWRIDRYAHQSLLTTPFYRLATDTHADPAVHAKARDARDKAQKAITQRRNQMRAVSPWAHPAQVRPNKTLLLEPGLPGFDPDLAQTQLRQAAEEFAATYRHPNLEHSSIAASLHYLHWIHLPSRFIYLSTADMRAERLRMKEGGEALLDRLFPRPPYRNDYCSGARSEASNATAPEGLLRALFDDQVHDSRAWFLHDWGREPFGSYLMERMVFFGSLNRREVPLEGKVSYEKELALNFNPVTGRKEPPRDIERPSILKDPAARAEAKREITALLEEWQRKDRERRGMQE